MDSNTIDWTKIFTIAVPAILAFLAAQLTNRRERIQWLAKQKAEQESIVGGMASQLSGAWGEMTTQMREWASKLQTETIDARTRMAIAEDRADKLEIELAEIRGRHSAALEELEKLRTRGLGVKRSNIK